MYGKCRSSGGTSSLCKPPLKFSTAVPEKPQSEQTGRVISRAAGTNVDIDLRELYFLIMHFLSAGPCQRTSAQLWKELLECQLLPRRYHAWFSRSGAHSGDDNDDGISFPLSYDNLVERYSHVGNDHLVKLLKQLIQNSVSPLHGKVGTSAPNAADVPTLLGFGSFSLTDCDRSNESQQVNSLATYLRWPHMQADQIRGLSLREIGGGFRKHHRAPSIRSACYAIAKPSTMVQKMQNIKKLRGHRSAVYCAIFDRSGRYVITGADDRLVKIWSMETALCLVSCRGHEGDITDLAVSSNNTLVASASNDFVIRVWCLRDGMPISVLRGHTGAVTAIAFSPRPSSVYQLLSSSDDGTCRIWDARYSQCTPRIYIPSPSEAVAGKSNGPSSNAPPASNGIQSHQILCCAYNANGTVFVTGSSDTYARVWSAFRSNADDSEEPIHELDVLRGHENDVNYVQFSGCAVSPKSSMFDSLKEDNVPKFKNSWFCHDNIVTCSRDGSAIIWIPRSRRSHGKFGRWTRAYHLKVPPPPLPPQPPRGGPRQRLLPTPRGVNMIVWSLDNRFVLAAIMDCRICVWNAVDGSLVHSLTGHTASSYVLDVHPFNPRIAMSAGYDGKTIIWDIWEGTPIRIYEIGRFQLVDGKFSQDGTSIVLSDEVGQIYLLNTGQGESQKDAKYDQFFLGDYRPLIRDAVGNVLDQETQLVPHRRNLQDPLCDSSMIPYQEPYQTMYQQRRLGALGVEWRPSSIQFVVGPDFSLGQDYEMPPLADLERMIEPLPEFLDAFVWEPENDAVSDDAGSDYNATEDFSSEGERASLCSGSLSDPTCSSEDSEVEHSHKDGLRRSGRKRISGVGLITSSGRRVKKRNLDERDGSISGVNRTKKSKKARKTSHKKSFKAKISRPQRVAARNALNMITVNSGTSTDEHDSDDSSNSETVIHSSNIQSLESDKKNLTLAQNHMNIEPQSLFEPDKVPEPQMNNGNRKRLVLKLSLRECKKASLPVDTRQEDDNQADLGQPHSTPPQENVDENMVSIRSKDKESSVDAIGLESQDRYESIGRRLTAKDEVNLEQFASDKDQMVRWGEVKIRSTKHSRSEDVMPTDDEVIQENQININGDDDQFKSEALHDWSTVRHCESVPGEEFGSSSLVDLQPGGTASILPYDGSLRMGVALSESDNCKNNESSDLNGFAGAEHTDELKENPPLKIKKLRIRTRVNWAGSPSNASNSHASANDFPENGTDATHKTRSTLERGTTQEGNTTTHSFKIRLGNKSVGTSKKLESSSMKASAEEWASSSRAGNTSRASKSKQDEHNDEEIRFKNEKKLHNAIRKLPWLMLSEQEAYRYIPQLGDEVVYLRQGHQEFIESTSSTERGPWRTVSGHISASEICKVEKLDYATFPGSGECCCKINLKFTGPSSQVVGKTFKLTLPELIDFPDFIVEKTRYDAAIKRNWTPRDKCLVWWWNSNGDGGTWWEGKVHSLQAKSDEFPESPWERYLIRYASTDSQRHSPWELYDPELTWENPRVDGEIRDKLLSALAKLEHSERKNQDSYGIQKLNEISQKMDFCNRFPVPLYPEVIKSRLENDYYRTLDAVKHDIDVMLTNAQSYFSKTSRVFSMMKRLSDWFTRTFSKMSRS